MYKVACLAYLIWKYGYVLKYGYYVAWYGSYLIPKKSPSEDKHFDEAWVLCDKEDSHVAKDEIVVD